MLCPACTPHSRRTSERTTQTGAEQRLWLGSDGQVSPSGKTCQPGSPGNLPPVGTPAAARLQSQGWPNPESSHGPSAIPAAISKAQSPPRTFRFRLGSRSTMSPGASSAGAPQVGAEAADRGPRGEGGAARSSHALPCPRGAPGPHPCLHLSLARAHLSFIPGASLGRQDLTRAETGLRGCHLQPESWAGREGGGGEGGVRASGWEGKQDSQTGRSGTISQRAWPLPQVSPSPGPGLPTASGGKKNPESLSREKTSQAGMGSDMPHLQRIPALHSVPHFVKSPPAPNYCR